ncbi:MAG: hypothetical protein K2R98_01145 [Gemmataceae bacterium]|nr:hypothetical protein [Gemmataceae bacterium]
MRLFAQLVTATDIPPDRRDEMFALMDRHYVNVQRSTFEADLMEKRWVIEVSDPVTGRLCGFSTQTILEVEALGRPIKALFSGDTIIGREHWGDQALAHVWGRLALSLIDAHPDAEFYWFLISKGYKTYRFLPVFFREFYPRHDAPTPDGMRPVLDALSVSIYPDEYDSSAGVIRTGPSQYRLRPDVADVTPERLRDPHVHYFNARNPGHVRGDELCCLTPLTRTNFTRAAYRVIGPEPAALVVS